VYSSGPTVVLVLHCSVREALRSSRNAAVMPVASTIRELRKLKNVTYPNGGVPHTADTRSLRIVLHALEINVDELQAFE
jgi:hypothetical protein